MPSYPKAPIYLFYGDQVPEILKARDTVMDMLLDKELRDGNLTEYHASGNRFGAEMVKIMDEVAGDLGTVSFIAGAPKIVVVNNPIELYAAAPGRARKPPAAKEKKSKPADTSYLSWIEKDLPDTGNHIILLAYEDESEGREVSERTPSALFQIVGKIGYLQRFREKRDKAIYRIEDAILSRSPGACIGAIRDLWKAGKSDQAVYNQVARTLRFMLQASIARDRRLTADPVETATYFPERAQFSLMQTQEFIRKKFVQRPPAYRTQTLLEAHRRLLDVYRALRPRPWDLYVPDQLALLERILMELFASDAP